MSQDPAAPATEPAKKSKKALLVVAVVVLGVVGGGGAGAFLAGPMLAGTVAAAADSLADSAGPGGDAEHDEDGAAGAGTVVLVDNMVLNPANSGGQRFLLVSVGISVKDQAVADAMKERDPELRDAVLRYLGAKQVDELSDIARRDSLKVGIRAAVTERFGKGSVRDVYFPQYVIQ